APFSSICRTTLYSLCVVSASTLSSGKRALSSLQKSTPLISGSPTSRSNTSGFQKPMELRQSVALCATPTTLAMPEFSMSDCKPSVRILWSSTMATLIILSIFCQFQFYVNLGSFRRRVNIQFALKCRHPLSDVLESHAFGYRLRVEPFAIVVHGKRYPVGFLHQLHVDVISLRVFQRIVDQLVDTSVHHDFHFSGQPGLVAEVMEIGCRDGGAKIG